jgi:hypothetical protein
MDMCWSCPYMPSILMCTSTVCKITILLHLQPKCSSCLPSWCAQVQFAKLLFFCSWNQSALLGCENMKLCKPLLCSTNLTLIIVIIRYECSKIVLPENSLEMFVRWWETEPSSINFLVPAKHIFEVIRFSFHCVSPAGHKMTLLYC